MRDHDGMPVTTDWPAPVAAGPVRATVRVPGSKSLTNRALVLAAQAGSVAVAYWTELLPLPWLALIVFAPPVLLALVTMVAVPVPRPRMQRLD